MRSHTPILSDQCDGRLCRSCPQLWRYFVTGVELRGKGDNATFLMDATEDHRPGVYVKLTRARWRRVARRWAGVAVPGCLTAAHLIHRPLHALGLIGPSPWGWVLIGYLSVLVSLAASFGVYRLVKWFPTRSASREMIRPAWRAVCEKTGVKYHRRMAARMIELPRGYGTGSETDNDEQRAVRVYLPKAVGSLPEKRQTELVRAVASRLGITDPRGEWRWTGERAYVDISPNPAPPRTVTLDDLRKAVLAAPMHAPVAGKGPNGIISADLEQDSPHVALTGPSGTGKSVLLRFLLMQRIRHGAGAIVLDYKRWSHTWLHDLPSDRVRYAWKIADIHDTLVAIGEEKHRRIGCDKSELGTFREVDIVVEEINSTIGALNRYWKGLRKEIIAAAKDALQNDLPYDPADLDPPLQSPAVAAMQEGVGMGRELQMHWWAAAQKLSARVFGSHGGDIRESFQLRFMAKWNRSLWKMLNDAMSYVACPSGPRGIWGVAIGDEFEVCRVPFVSEQEARTFAMSGAPVSGTVLGPQSAVPVLDVPTVPRYVSLRTALTELPGQDGPHALSIEGLRTAAKRLQWQTYGKDPADARSDLFSLAEILAWREERIGIAQE